MALTMDIFQPAHPNGCGLLFLVNGGWLSSKSTPMMVTVRPEDYRVYLERGYTVFSVVTSSQPKFIISEQIEDVLRAVRFARHSAPRFGVRPDRLGALGLRVPVATFDIVDRQPWWAWKSGCSGPRRSRKQRHPGSSLFLSSDRFSELWRRGSKWGRCRTAGCAAGRIWSAGRNKRGTRKNSAAKSRLSTTSQTNYRRH